MAQVDFYVLDRVDEHARNTLACKLAEKAWRLENTIHIHTMTREDAERLDNLLWTFREIFQKLEALSKVLSYVETNYIEPVEGEKLIDSAIKGMLSDLDPHHRKQGRSRLDRAGR